MLGKSEGERLFADWHEKWSYLREIEETAKR